MKQAELLSSSLVPSFTSNLQSSSTSSPSSAVSIHALPFQTPSPITEPKITYNKTKQFQYGYHNRRRRSNRNVFTATALTNFSGTTAEISSKRVSFPQTIQPHSTYSDPVLKLPLDKANDWSHMGNKLPNVHSLHRNLKVNEEESSFIPLRPSSIKPRRWLFSNTLSDRSLLFLPQAKSGLEVQHPLLTRQSAFYSRVNAKVADKTVSSIVCKRWLQVSSAFPLVQIHGVHRNVSADGSIRKTTDATVNGSKSSKCCCIQIRAPLGHKLNIKVTISQGKMSMTAAVICLETHTIWLT